MSQIDTLQALLDDVKGNDCIGHVRNMSSYLKSMSSLADAMARTYWQQFELDAIAELGEVKRPGEVEQCLATKKAVAQRELELSNLNVKLVEFTSFVSAGCFLSKENAANALREIADELEKRDSALFPKPWTEDDFTAYAAGIGARYIDLSAETDIDVKRLMEQLTRNAKTPSAKGQSAQPQRAKNRSKSK